MTTPAPDEWLAPLVARVAEAPAIPLGDQLFQRLLRHRIVFLGQQVDDDLANRIGCSNASAAGWPNASSSPNCRT